MIEKNPCAGVTKFREAKSRERFLTPEEITRLYAVMKEDINPTAVAALKFLLLTGLRRSEALQARWTQVDLTRGLLYLPTTKAGKPRHAVLNAPARELLAHLPSRGVSEWVFPGRFSHKPLNNPTKCFQRLLQAAGIERMRPHDLRHSFASTAINAGASLYEVQALLGHSSPQMTARYSHLADASIRRATEAVGQVVDRATLAEPPPAVVPPES